MYQFLHALLLLIAESLSVGLWELWWQRTCVVRAAQETQPHRWYKQWNVHDVNSTSYSKNWYRSNSDKFVESGLTFILLTYRASGEYAHGHCLIETQKYRSIFSSRMFELAILMVFLTFNNCSIGPPSLTAFSLTRNYLMHSTKLSYVYHISPLNLPLFLVVLLNNFLTITCECCFKCCCCCCPFDICFSKVTMNSTDKITPSSNVRITIQP